MGCSYTEGDAAVTHLPESKRHEIKKKKEKRLSCGKRSSGKNSVMKERERKKNKVLG